MRRQNKDYDRRSNARSNGHNNGPHPHESPPSWVNWIHAYAGLVRQVDFVYRRDYSKGTNAQGRLKRLYRESTQRWCLFVFAWQWGREFWEEANELTEGVLEQWRQDYCDGTEAARLLAD